MVSITRRTAILAFARLTNQALAFLGPLFLVRLLTVEQYGQYRDFLLYATLLVPWIRLDISSSLAYFVPKEPENERLYLSQATYFVVVTSIVVVSFVALFSGFLPSETAREYILPLCLYLLFLTNIDAWEVYWLAKRETAKVMYYSIARLGFRMAVVVSTAYVSGDVATIIWALVGFEGLRMTTFVVYVLRTRLFTIHFSLEAMKQQLEFVLPLALSVIVFTVNTNLGQFLISIRLGAATLAIYTIGAYLQPIITVFRNSVSDVILPEITSKRDLPPNQALHLWQRATVVYCAVIFPLAILLFHYAEVVVTTLFTRDYVAAVPVFQVLCLALIYPCFDFALPLRSVKRTRPLAFSSVVSLAVNTLLLILLFGSLGILAPAIARVASAVITSIYLAFFVTRYCGFTARTLLPWSEIGKITLISLGCVPILYVGDAFDIAPLLRAVIIGIAYSLCYGVLLRMCAIPEVTRAINRVLAGRT